MTSKHQIPIELLRRSCRLHKPIVEKQTHHQAIQDKECVAVKRKVKKLQSETSDAIPATKKVKKESLVDIKSTIAEHVLSFTEDVKLPEFRKKKIAFTISPSPATTPIDPPQAEGYLEVNLDELDLERTLLGGQSFRWVKSELTDGKPIFTGVILKFAMQLWRVSSDRIAFKTLNKEAVEIKISSKIALLEDYFQLKYNLKQLYEEWSANDKHLAKCCEQYRGFRILRQDPAENVFSFICATNNNIKRISQMINKLCRRYGNILENNDNKLTIYDSFQSFPDIARLAEDDVFQCLRYELGFGYRAKFIHETAKQVVKLSQIEHKTPREYLLSLRSLPYKETCKRLMQFQGVGRKVADCICLMSMDHLNAVPIDCHIYEVVCRNYLPNLRQERKTLTDSVHDLIADHFHNLHGPLAGWSTSVLFISELKHLELEGSKAKKKTRVKAKPNH